MYTVFEVQPISVSYFYVYENQKFFTKLALQTQYYFSLHHVQFWDFVALNIQENWYIYLVHKFSAMERSSRSASASASYPFGTSTVSQLMEFTLLNQRVCVLDSRK